MGGRGWYVRGYESNSSLIAYEIRECNILRTRQIFTSFGFREMLLIFVGGMHTISVSKYCQLISFSSLAVVSRFCRGRATHLFAYSFLHAIPMIKIRLASNITNDITESDYKCIHMKKLSVYVC